MTIFNHFNNSQDDGPEPKALIEAVRRHVLQLRHFLKLQRKKWYLPATPRPWFLVLGPSGSGKSTLLTQSNLAPKIIGQEDSLCTTWLCEQAAYLEVSGQALKTDYLPAWFKIQRRFNARRSIKNTHCVFVLSLAELLQLNPLQLDAELNDCVAVLSALSNTHKRPLPVHLVFTHLDVIRGSQAFFNDFNDEQLAQPFGFMRSENQDLIAAFQQQFLNLVQQLHQQLLKRLHQTTSRAQRHQIHGFLLQLESLNDPLLDVLQKLFSPNQNQGNYRLHSVHFCSSRHGTNTIDQISKPLQQAFALTTTPTTSPTATHTRPQFVGNVFTVINQSILQANQYQSRLKRIVTLGGLLLCLGGGTLWSMRNFRHDIHLLNTVAMAVRQYDVRHVEATKHSNKAQLVHQIDAQYQLYQGLQAIRNDQRSVLAQAPTKETVQQYKRLYQKAWAQQTLMPIAHFIEAYLHQLSPTQADEKYFALKAYLMLHQTQHFDVDYFMAWLQHSQSIDGQTRLPHKTIKKLRELLQEPLPKQQPDYDTVAKIRKDLNALPKSFLAYLALKDRYFLKSVSASTPNAQLDAPPVVPNLYQRHQFKKIYEDTTQQVIKSIHHGNWVLGKNWDKNHSSSAALLTELRQFYLDDYIEWWFDFVAPPINTKHLTLSHIYQMLTDLSTTKTNLSTRLSLAFANTKPVKHPSATMAVFNDAVASQFSALNQFTEHGSTSLSLLLQQFQKELDGIINALDPDQAAYQYASKEFNVSDSTLQKGFDTVDALPSRLRTWGQQLFHFSWQRIVEKTTTHIERQWKNKVYAEYRQHILGHYPFGHQGEVSLEDFTHFFADKGSLNQFYTQMVKPFLDTHHADWVAKRRHRIEIKFSETAIEQFIRAHLIHKMFFGKNPNKVAFSFQLTPLSLASDLKEFRVHLDDQHYYGYPGASRTQKFVWPHLASHHHIAFELTDTAGNHNIISKKGDWALFKFFDQYPLVQTNANVAEYLLTLTLNDKPTKFKLQTNNLINPFVPNLVKMFELPTQLIQSETVYSIRQ